MAIKPDGVQRHLVGEIIRRFERKGLQLVGLKLLQVSGPARTAAARAGGVPPMLRGPGRSKARAASQAPALLVTAGGVGRVLPGFWLVQPAVVTQAPNPRGSEGCWHPGAPKPLLEG